MVVFFEKRVLSFFLFFTLLFIFFTKYSLSINSSLPSFEYEFNNWRVFTIQQGGKKVCYVVASPISLSGNHKDNRNPYIMVSFFNGVIKQEISICAGYLYKKNSIVSVSIDGKQKRFIAETDTLAWVERYGTDKNIINDMLHGFNIFVFSESYANTYSVDTYSLSGFKKAYNKAMELCK